MKAAFFWYVFLSGPLADVGKRTMWFEGYESCAGVREYFVELAKEHPGSIVAECRWDVGHIINEMGRTNARPRPENQ